MSDVWEYHPDDSPHLPGRFVYRLYPRGVHLFDHRWPRNPAQTDVAVRGVMYEVLR